MTFFFSLGGVTIGWFGYEWTINLLPMLDDYWGAFSNLMHYFGVFITTSIWGALQWTILWGGKIRIIWWKWVLATALCSLASTILSGTQHHFSDAFSLAANAIVYSIPTIGISQWLLLRHHFFKSGWWVLINFIGVPIILFAFNLAFNSGYFIGALLTSIPFSAITGGLLLWLIRYQKKIV